MARRKKINLLSKKLVFSIKPDRSKSPRMLVNPQSNTSTQGKIQKKKINQWIDPNQKIDIIPG